MAPASATEAPPGEVPANSNDDTGRLARPYAITGGRTDAPKFLHLESQLRRTARSDEGAATHRWEAARIIEMTGRPVALVEVAARVGLPVGVTKIVVADLIEQGALTTGALPQKTSFSSLLERVLDGLDSV